MALCALKPISLKPPSKHKTRTWNFAGEFLIRKQFQKDQVKFGAWTREQIIELGPTFIKSNGYKSARVDAICPNLINVGPNSINWSLVHFPNFTWSFSNCRFHKNLPANFHVLVLRIGGIFNAHSGILYYTMKIFLNNICVYI